MLFHVFEKFILPQMVSHIIAKVVVDNRDAKIKYESWQDFQKYSGQAQLFASEMTEIHEAVRLRKFDKIFSFLKTKVEKYFVEPPPKKRIVYKRSAPDELLNDEDEPYIQWHQMSEEEDGDSVNLVSLVCMSIWKVDTEAFSYYRPDLLVEGYSGNVIIKVRPYNWLKALTTGEIVCKSTNKSSTFNEHFADEKVISFIKENESFIKDYYFYIECSFDPNKSKEENIIEIPPSYFFNKIVEVILSEKLELNFYSKFHNVELIEERDLDIYYDEDDDDEYDDEDQYDDNKIGFSLANSAHLLGVYNTGFLNELGRFYFWNVQYTSRRTGLSKLTETSSVNVTHADFFDPKSPFKGDLPDFFRNKIEKHLEHSSVFSCFVYGKPGNGKTLLCNTLSTNKKTIIINNRVFSKLSTFNLIKLTKKLMPEVIIIDDITEFSDYLNDKLSWLDSSNNLKAHYELLGCTLQIFMTGNNPEKIKQSFKRPGRIDDVIDFDAMLSYVPERFGTAVDLLCSKIGVKISNKEKEVLIEVFKHLTTAYVEKILFNKKVYGKFYMMPYEAHWHSIPDDIKDKWNKSQDEL